MQQRPTLVLVDGHALAFRAFFALRDTGMSVRATGEPTYAVQGFLSILLNLLRERQPEYVAVSFDIGRTFRDDLYPDYKAGRAETPADFHPQLERIKQIINALNIPIYTAENYEADDVIGTLCRQAEAQGVDTLIITGDTDTLQLVNDYTKVLLANPYGKGNVSLYDEAQVRERYKGLAPNQLADLRGLKGDTSDNIPGVKGIGEAGAISMLNEWGSVENIYANLDKVANRYRSKLDGQQEAARFSTHLATIVTNAPVTLDLEATKVHDYDRDTVLALFSQLEFRKLVDKLPLSSQVSAVQVVAIPQTTNPNQLTMFDDATPPSAEPIAQSGDYQAVTTSEQLAELVRILTAAERLIFDVETNSLNLFSPVPAKVVGIALTHTAGCGWYIPLGHRSGQQLPIAEVVAALQPLFSDPQKAVVAHNGKFDMSALSLIGLDVPHLSFDTAIAAALLGKRQSLKDLAFAELRDADDRPIEMTRIETLIGTGKKQITMDQVAIEQVTPYASADVDMTARLLALFMPQLGAIPAVREVFEQIEMPLSPVLMRMEACGIGLDRAQLVQQGQVLGQSLREIEQHIADFVGEPLNINSRFDLNDLLFIRLKLPTANLKRLAGTTRSGGAVYSVNAETLEDLQTHDQSGIVAMILRYRRLSKLKSTYVDALIELINQQTGRVHTQYRQIGAETGRLSSDSPNLQNIPVRSEEGREIRRAFVARPGHVLMTADYSQIELRVLAHITADPALVEVFKTGQDIHAATAARLFDIPMDEVSKNQRRIAKMTVFGIIYGISSFGLAARTALSRTEAQQMINGLFAQYPGLKSYIERTLERVKAVGYVETLFGRRRYFRELQDGGVTGPRRSAFEREATNAGIQGTAADLIKLAMIRLEQALIAGGYQAKMLLQVHDELVLEVPEDERDAVAQLVCDTMTQVYPDLAVPLEVNVETGLNWDQLQRWHAPA
ncbi:MAG TPA: DNA polymerase I [Herpetosiphon sp.]|uniref:DNA polymerase I n=1 Tax=Herpetosiphon aurantiacus (strain ATCC 23779 / DSM 785 / 114-95) TaxID=316274 RepID=A9B4G4_HERA2|nr:DNA polymerase I [Herpetosiphon sp.]ABX02721.1 DNA polymerase I [Herpetosiphon aurantiacus DSM 785]HBW50688.1 DNA polymerase I [Herpetosiphon sp.]